MATQRSQAAMPRRRPVVILLSVLQIALLSATFMVPASVISSVLRNPACFEELQEEATSVAGPKLAHRRLSFVLPHNAAKDPAAAAVRQARIAACSRDWSMQSTGHRLANGLLAPLTC